MRKIIFAAWVNDSAKESRQPPSQLVPKIYEPNKHKPVPRLKAPRDPSLSAGCQSVTPNEPELAVLSQVQTLCRTWGEIQTVKQLLSTGL